jgi:hypothetical protein
MKVYEYDDIKSLNQALGSFARNKVPVSSVQLTTVVDKIHFFVFADPWAVSQKATKVESKTEEKAKKTLKVKKEEKPSEKPSENKAVAEVIVPVTPSENSGTVIEGGEKKE